MNVTDETYDGEESLTGTLFSVVRAARRLLKVAQKLILWSADDRVDQLQCGKIETGISFLTDQLESTCVDKAENGDGYSPMVDVPLLLWLDNGLIVEGMYITDDELQCNVFSFESAWLSGRGGRYPTTDRSRSADKPAVVKWQYRVEPNVVGKKQADYYKDRVKIYHRYNGR